MSTKKILEFNPEGQSLFCQFLAHLAKEQGWDFQFETHPEYNADLLDSADMVRVDMSLSDGILEKTNVQPTLVRTVRCVDSFVKEDGKWYPRLLFYEALRKVLVDSARDMDIRAPAFVIGDTEKARVVTSVLAQMGFGEIYVVGQDPISLSVQMQLLKRSHLGIHFQGMMADQLTILSVSAAIVINTVDISKDRELLSDLSYFNFMKRDGYALDLNLLPFVNPLLEEAERAELRVLHPSLVAAQLTLLWLEKLVPESRLKVEDLRESWKTFLKQISPSV